MRTSLQSAYIHIYIYTHPHSFISTATIFEVFYACAWGVENGGVLWVQGAGLRFSMAASTHGPNKPKPKPGFRV